MSRKKPVVNIESFGRYTPWDRQSRQLPRILEFTDRIEAIEGNEFGMILSITGGKGMRLDYCIEHPPFPDDRGNPEPPFTGSYYVNSNRFEFFIGDSIWNPVENKTGIWTISVANQGLEIARRQFEIVPAG